MDHGGGHAIGSHQLAHLGGFTFHIDTLIMTWICMGIVILFAVLSTRNLKSRPQGWQNFIEMIVDIFHGQLETNIGPKGKKVAPLLMCLFIFLVVANELGLVPGFVSPTADINTTLGLAIMIGIIVQLLGIMNKGPVRHVKHFFEPFVPFVIIHVVEEIARPITLAFRLFGNILAGEILLMIFGMLVPFFIPTAWLAVSVFIGILQAAIFTMLSISYLSNSLADNHH